jgi:hypothetical protein
VICKNPAHHVLVDLQAEGVRDLLGDARATKARIEAFDLENRSYQFLGRTLGAGAPPGFRAKQPMIFSSDQGLVESQQRRGPDCDRDFQDALRGYEYRTRTQQDSVQGAQPRGLLSRTVQDQQLMLQEKRFGNDGAGTAWGDGPDRCYDQMSYEDEPIPHTANDDRG